MFSHSCSRNCDNGKFKKRKGADSSHPAPRHREAPTQQARQAAPTWARSVSCCVGWKIRGFGAARSQSYAKCFLLNFLVFYFFVFCFLNILRLAEMCRVTTVQFRPRERAGDPVWLIRFSNRWHVGCGATGVWAQNSRLARNGAQRNDPLSPPLIELSRVAFRVAQGVQRDVPGERRVLGARVLRSEGLARPVFRTTPRWLQMPGRRDMLARVGLSPRSRVGDFMPDDGDPLTGWLAGCPVSGAALCGYRVLCEGCGLHSLCHADAEQIHFVAILGWGAGPRCSGV